MVVLCWCLLVLLVLLLQFFFNWLWYLFSKVRNLCLWVVKCWQVWIIVGLWCVVSQCFIFSFFIVIVNFLLKDVLLGVYMVWCVSLWKISCVSLLLGYWMKVEIIGLLNQFSVEYVGILVICMLLFLVLSVLVQVCVLLR